MQIAELWLEDLFKIYLGSTLPLDRGPFQSQPSLYNPVTLGNPSVLQLQQVIESKLRLKKQQGDVAVLGYYVRFVNNLQGVRDEVRRNVVRNWIRYPRVLVTNRNEYDSAVHSLIMALSAFEDRWWLMHGGQAREAQVLGDRIAMFGAYSGPLDSFNQTIRAITRLASESILNCPSVVQMEIDFEVHPMALGSLTASPYPFTREAAQNALKAWNALFPRQRSAAVNYAGELSDALHEKYRDLHGRRGLTVPD